MASIEDLCEELLRCKAAEEEARDRRVKAEVALSDLLECDRDASRTHTVADGAYRVTVKRPVNRRLDVKAWDAIKDRLPQEVWPVVYKPALDDKGCRWLAQNDPSAWAICAGAVSESDGKVAVTVKATQEKS